MPLPDHTMTLEESQDLFKAYLERLKIPRINYSERIVDGKLVLLLEIPLQFKTPETFILKPLAALQRLRKKNPET